MGNNTKSEVESGIGKFSELIGGENDADFFKKNYGKGKQCPGGPTYNFRSKKILCMVLWSENGSITCEILTDIFRTFDIYEFFRISLV